MVFKSRAQKRKAVDPPAEEVPPPPKPSRNMRRKANRLAKTAIAARDALEAKNKKAISDRQQAEKDLAFFGVNGLAAPYHDQINKLRIKLQYYKKIADEMHVVVTEGHIVDPDDHRRKVWLQYVGYKNQVQAQIEPLLVAKQEWDKKQTKK